jgi:hypothetical protein
VVVVLVVVAVCLCLCLCLLLLLRRIVFESVESNVHGTFCVWVNEKKSKHKQVQGRVEMKASSKFEMTNTFTCEVLSVHLNEEFAKLAIVQ